MDPTIVDAPECVFRFAKLAQISGQLDTRRCISFHWGNGGILVSAAGV